MTSGRKNRSGRVFLRTAILLAAIGVVGGGVLLLAGGDRAADVGRSADLVAAQVMDFDVTASASGELQARRQVEIKNPLETQTRITELVPEGRFAQEGEILIRLNTDTIEQQIRTERLQVIEARNVLDQAEGAYRIQLSENESRRQEAELRVALADLALQRWREGEVAKRREELRIRAEKAADELVRLRDKLERTERLFERSFKSRDELELDRIAYKQAIADDVIAQLEVQIYENYQYPEDEKTRLADVDKAKSELARALEQNEINLRSRDAARQTAAEQLRLREENLEKYEGQFRASTIRAPTAGLVVYSTSMEANRWGRGDPLEVGTDVYPNQLLIVLPDTTEMVASVRIHESLAARVRPGQRALVAVEAVDGTFTGTVESVGVLAESGGWRDPNRREYTVRILLDQQPGTDDLKPSMRCDARITLNSVSQALAIPVAAVFHEGQMQFCYVVRNGRFVKRPVMIGRRSDMFAEVLAGLDAGERVLLREPRPGEVLAAAWDPEELEAAGYKLGEDGRVVRTTGESGPPIAMPAAPSQRSGAARAGRG